MSLLKRIWDFLRGKAHKAMDSVENPIEQAELTIRDLEAAHSKSINALAQSKSIVFKLKEESKRAAETAEGYLSKATQLKAKLASSPDEATTAQLKSDILLMLNRHENFNKEATSKAMQAENQEAKTSKMAADIKKLQDTISTTKIDIKNKKVNLELAQQNKAINKELSALNVDGIQNRLADIQTRIDDNNNEAEAWASIESELESDEARINKMLNETSDTDDNELLSKFLAEEVKEEKTQA